MTHKTEFIETMDSIIDYCQSAKGMELTEEEYGKLEDAATSAQGLMYGIVEGTEEVLKESNTAEVVQLQQKFSIGQLTKEEYPMVYAFWHLNLTLSNSAQSAPSCISQKTKAEWNVLEDIMFEKMEAAMFVALALDLRFDDADDDYIFEQHFPGWIQDWV